MTDWIEQFPKELQDRIQAVVSRDASSQQVFVDVINFIEKEESNKRRKLINGLGLAEDLNDAVGSSLDELSPSPTIHHDTIIFEIPQVSFMSPVRKRMNLTFHLIEQNGQGLPVLSIVNPANNSPDISYINLQNAVKLCLILPILGNSTNPQKKGVVTLCCWMHDLYYTDANVSKDPLILQLNLDAIKKLMIKNEKLPADIENQFDLTNYRNSVILNPIQERIIDYFTRQFKLCGVNLVSYLPSDTIVKNSFIVNQDTAVALSTSGNDSTKPAMVMVECHKGARDGNLILLEQNEHNPAYILFAFRKPTLVYAMSRVLSASYTSVTKHTFSLTIIVLNEKDEERSIEFSIIDQAYFQLIDDFIRSHGISDDSFNEDNKEKVVDSKANVVRAAVNGMLGTTTPATTNSRANGDGGDDDDDEEEDGDFEAGNEDDDSDVAEEYDSAAESVEGEGEEEEEEEKEEKEEDVEEEDENNTGKERSKHRNGDVFTRSKEE